jgi:hypothetical protein
MMHEHFQKIQEIVERIGGTGPAEHMPLDTLRIAQAVQALLAKSAELDRRLRLVEQQIEQEEPRAH